MTIQVREDDPITAPRGCRALVVWGQPGELARWLETTNGIEWVGRPQKFGDQVLVRVAVRQQLPRSSGPSGPVARSRRADSGAWWHDRDRLVVASLAAGVALGALALAVWLVVTAVVAIVTWVAANWPILVGFGGFGLIFALMFRMTRSKTGGCSGIHCSGCSNH